MDECVSGSFSVFSKLSIIPATHVGLDLSHSTSPLALVQTKGVVVGLFDFDPRPDGHDCTTIPCH